MFIARCNSFPMVRQAGATMSSRQIAPKLGARAMTVSTISLMSCVLRQIGSASTPAKVLKTTLLPSITGRIASGPTMPSPKADDPSETIATVLPRMVWAKDSTGFAAMSRQGWATPGV